jgi:perosamine synthetase
MLNNKKISQEVINNIKKTLNFNKKFNNHNLHEPLIEKIDIEPIKNSIESGFVSSVGIHLKLFKKKIKSLTNCNNIVLTSSGSTALHTVLAALEVSADHEVLIPNFNYIASANSILMSGATPHFIDIEERTLGIDVKKLDDYLKKNTFQKKNVCINKKTKKKVKFCIALHTYGYPCDIKNLKKILDKRRIVLIEDAAEAVGSFYNKKHLGTFGFAGIFSFNGNKIITSGGGGAIVSNNKKFSQKCEKLSTTAKGKHKFLFFHDQLGYNYRMPNINAALGYAQILKLSNILKSKRILNQKYRESFEGNKYIEIFSGKNNNEYNNWLNVAILNKKFSKFRNLIISECIKSKLNVRPGWTLMHQIKYLKKYPKMNLSNSISIFKRLICLPSSPHYFYKKK